MKAILSTDFLKLIAIIAMTVDHVAWVLFPGYQIGIVPIVMHIIGRITCPIMCFFVAEGYHHTKNVKRYTNRLFLFSFISHFAYVYFSLEYVDWRSFIPFYYGDFLNQTSVLWALAWGLVMLRVTDSKKIKEPAKYLIIILICLLSFPADWSCIASLCILAFGTNRNNLKKQMLWMVFYVAIYSVVYFFAIDKVYALLQMAVILAVPFLWLYSGKKSNSQRLNGVIKYFFYLYYPLHLFVLGFVKTFI